jgi:hypothetical protein
MSPVTRAIERPSVESGVMRAGAAGYTAQRRSTAVRTVRPGMRAHGAAGADNRHHDDGAPHVEWSAEQRSGRAWSVAFYGRLQRRRRVSRHVATAHSFTRGPCGGRQGLRPARQRGRHCCGSRRRRAWRLKPAGPLGRRRKTRGSRECACASLPRRAYRSFDQRQQAKDEKRDEVFE